MWGWIKTLSIGRKVLLGLGSFIAIGAVGSAISPPSTSAPKIQTTPSNNHAVKSENIQVKTETKTNSIPFQTTTQNDSNLASGTTKITKQGVNGVETLTYKVTYTNGIETDRQQVSDETTTQPINQVTAIGTYIAPAQNCPNGTYVNSAGNTVCSPYSAPSAPAGATAQCVDGTYSFSQSRSGTCSHHGGVAQWL